MIHSLTADTIAATNGEREPSAPGTGQTLAEYTDILEQIRNQPAWRYDADKQMDYVDGNQLDSDILAKQRAVGIPPAIENLMGPAVKAVTGFEAKTRTDWRVTTDGVGAEGEPVADALNYKLNQAERTSGADVACGEAFRPQYCVGIGWVEVARNSDPFLPPYRCVSVHRNEIWWDMKAKQKDLKDARWMRRKKWTDGAVAKLRFAKHADLIDHCLGGWSGQWEPALEGGGATNLAMSWDHQRGWSIEEAEWMDTFSKRVCLDEIWYRRWEAAVVLMTPDGRVFEYDKANAVHVIAVASGHAKPQKVVIAKMYLAYWMGPHKLVDGASPYKHRDFPYVPFWSDKEDRTGVPVGAGKHMMYLQDSVNSAISKIRWGLAAMRTERTKGAVAMTDDQYRKQVARPDADIILDATHMAKAGARYEVKRDFEINEQQYRMMVDARAGIERLSVSNAFQGKEGTATSGTQEATQVEQSVQSLGEVMANFKEGRTQVGNLLLSLIVEDMAGKEETVVIPKSPVRDEKVIKLNTPVVDPMTHVKYLDNDVQRVRTKVALNDVPSTPSFRSQQLQSLTEAFKAMPQEYQVIAMPHLLALMDIPEKDQIISEIRDVAKKESPEQIQVRIDQAVDEALRQSDHAIRSRELDEKYNPEKMRAEIDKIVAERVKISVEGAFAAVQGGAQLAAMPTIAAVADAILERSGWRPPIPAGMDPDLPVVELPAGVQVPPVAQNTSPMEPPVPATGMTGIETATPADNLSAQ